MRAYASASWKRRTRVGRFECEGWRLRKDGSRFWANVVITAVRDPEDGSLIGFAEGHARPDRTEALAEEALRESEERFRLTIDEAPIGMALVALDGRFVRVNRALCEIVGYAPDELTRLTFQDITHPDDLDDRPGARRPARSRRDPPIPAREALHPQGRRRSSTIMLSASILRDRRRRAALLHRPDRGHHRAQARGGGAAAGANRSFGRWPNPCRRSSGPPTPMG